MSDYASASDLPGHAERGMSAPPEVVFNTATDPARAGWLPEPLRQGQRPQLTTETLCARWDSESGEVTWMAQLQVRPIDAGGAQVRLDLAVDPPEPRLDELASESLDGLARQVADNLTAG
ncbi:SRPBCC family protein [Micromonospora polyrhachis]|uniref:Polyketide cyclase / dehydrase and lipid transport n=1 Tax=Micromonospora polyrhachis TaxID=1282883 RepID=A0A7W7WR33_9ACTN|nr:hypothetical protein [Micromonospora polyrhachis]MBB4960439.1 hypothetical protein [Micromonospora polyrhachis]